MRLLHFNGKICKHMVEIMPGVKATYQMEQEFHPYLDIEFLTYAQHDEQNSGIILQTKNGNVKRYYDFKNNTDIQDLRDLIWEYLLKEKDIVEVDETEQNNDRKVKPNRVIQGWSNIVKEHQDHVYPNIKPPTVSLPKESNLRSLKPVFRLNPNDKQTKTTCKLSRYQECTDNYQRKSAEFDRCIAEVNWVCENGYPNNKLNKHNAYANNIWANIHDDLVQSGGYVNKQQFDNIIDAGLFYDTGLRSGNKVANYRKLNQIENFGNDSINYKSLLWVIIIIAIISGLAYMKGKN